MSGDNFLSRWAKRKQLARSAEPDERAEPAGRSSGDPSPATGEAGRADEPGAGGEAWRGGGGPAADAGGPPPGTAGPSSSLRPDREREGGAFDAGSPAEDLPRIEDVTATSDLSAFLRAGVPAALRNAALRKAWSLDPLIRDFASPAEYDWDFNAPGVMAGFGPAAGADSAGRALAALRSVPKLGSDLAGSVAAGKEAPAAGSPVPGEGGTPADGEVAGPEGLAAAGQDGPAPPAAGPLSAAAAAPEAPPENEAAADRPRRRHGGAIPS